MGGDSNIWNQAAKQLNCDIRWRRAIKLINNQNILLLTHWTLQSRWSFRAARYLSINITWLAAVMCLSSAVHCWSGRRCDQSCSDCSSGSQRQHGWHLGQRWQSGTFSDFSWPVTCVRLFIEEQTTAVCCKEGVLIVLYFQQETLVNLAGLLVSLVLIPLVTDNPM